MVWLGSPGGPRCLKEIAGSLPQPFSTLLPLEPLVPVLWCASVAWGLLTHGHAKFRFTVFLLSGTLEGEVVALTLPLSPD